MGYGGPAMDVSGQAAEADGDAALAAPAPGRRSRRERREAAASEPLVVDVDVVVVGAGQAGLSAGYHLRRAGLVAVGTSGWERAARTFVVLDENPRPGGAWQHRWPALTMGAAHRVHDLPGMALRPTGDGEPAALVVPEYFGQYEEAFELQVQRPVRADRVTDDGTGRLVVSTHHVDHPEAAVLWRARGLVNASGTWTKPFWPAYPGQWTFRGRQLHTRDFRTPGELADGPVVVVGGGTSAVQILLLLAPLTATTWVTRRPPQWVDAEFTPEYGRDSVARVAERTAAGLPPGSVVSATGLPLTPVYREGIAAGVLRARPMFERVVPEGVVFPAGPAPVGWVDGPTTVEARTILWATGFRAALDHLAPLGLRGPGGGIVMDGTQVAADHRVQLVGYGPSASTIGANRAGREAVQNLLRVLDAGR
ncbi:NAD(P)-binding domain-containing protein [Cellulomonas sp. 73-92]|uniref:NAD(P)-binding domain-containing protein n=1 Tax=Cellulomonas sp. 73-92 TaxID=1895740 RepID=UPI0025C3B1E6|nr:NAD(P)-binding domain-containing protein [Cellulomonas sp. 73-92]